MNNVKLHSLNHHHNLVASQGYGDCDKSVNKIPHLQKRDPFNALWLILENAQGSY